MPTFEFTSPEGVKYSVDGPEGATAEQAFQVLQQQLGTPNKEIDPSVPRVDVTGHVIRDPQVAPADPSLMDRITGGIEAARSVVSNGVLGTVGAVGGTIGGLAGAVLSGEFGTPQSVTKIEQAAQDGAESLGQYAYQPRTQLGQEYTQNVGDAMAASMPLMLMPELAAAGAGARAGANVMRETARNMAPAMEAADAAAVAGKAGRLRDVVTAPAGSPEAPAVAQIRKVSPAIADRVQRTLSRNPEPAPTPGTKGSVGASAVDVADQRRQLASDLPVPIELTKGQAERSFDQQAFEREIAKAPVGEPLRERFAQQNEDILRNMDAWFDQTGAQAPTLRAVGNSVDKALVEKAGRDKAQVNVAYNTAKKSPEALAEVNPGEKFMFPMDGEEKPTSLIDYLNNKPSGLQTTGLTDHAKQYAVRLGIAAKDQDGNLIPLKTNVKTMEQLRKEISQAAGYEPIDKYESTMLKGIIDGHTEPVSGPLYQQARRLRENYAKQYEDRAVIAKLLNTKKGMADRQVALEDVFDHSIMKGSLDNVRHVRRVLHTGGEAGQQAWRELQGATISHLKELATSNVALDVRGNPIVSAAKLDKAIKGLDAEGKLDFIFGKKNAQQLRDANDLVKLIHTAPPGSVQTSNNIVLLQHLTNFGDSGFLSKIPSSTLKVLRELAKFQKKRELQKRIEQALVQNNTNSKNKPPVRPDGITLH